MIDNAYDYCVWKLVSSISGQINPKTIEVVFAGCPLNTHLYMSLQLGIFDIL